MWHSSDKIAILDIAFLDIALWCKNQIEHSIWDESLLFSNFARSLEYSSSSTLVGLSYHICGKLDVAFKASPSSQHQHCTDEAQDAFLASLVSSVGKFVEVFRSFSMADLFPLSVILHFSPEVYSWRGGLVPLVSPRVARK